uniref:Uncharacterized protein n=1 Tax=Oryza punctata TaxID=4537 RepID=A0A0E0MIA9_ORYPU
MAISCLVAFVIMATALSSCKADENTDVCFYAGLRACQVKMCGAYCLKYYGNLTGKAPIATSKGNAAAKQDQLVVG